MLESMHNESNTTEAAFNIISAIVESNLYGSEDYTAPYKKTKMLQKIIKSHLSLKDQTYKVIIEGRVVGIILRIRAIKYKGILQKIEKLQSQIKEEVSILTGYDVSYIHVKLV